MDYLDNDRLNSYNYHIVGCGATGSSVALHLGKLGVEDITLWDDDVINEHNYPNQMLPEILIEPTTGKEVKTLGVNKCEVLAHLLRLMSSTKARFKTEKCLGDKEINPRSIVILCVDDMGETGRAGIWKNIQSAALLIDTRIALTSGNVQFVEPWDATKGRTYEGTLFSNAEMAELPCTAKSTIGTPALVSALVNAGLVHWINGVGERATQHCFDLTDSKYIIKEGMLQ